MIIIIPKVFSMVNVFTSLFLRVSTLSTAHPQDRAIDFSRAQYAYNAMFQEYVPQTMLHIPTNKPPPQCSFQLIILAILATRMHLHLWHVDRQIHSSAVMLIPLTDVSSVGRTG